MVTRREIGFVVGGGGIVAAGGYVNESGLLNSIGDTSIQQFPQSDEFASLTWGDDGWLTITTEPGARGQSIALAPGNVEDPLAADNVGANIDERGAVVELGLAELVRRREVQRMTLGSYRLRDSRSSAELVDVVRFPVPQSVRERVR